MLFYSLLRAIMKMLTISALYGIKIKALGKVKMA